MLLTAKKVTRVLVCSSLFEKMDRRNCIKFYVKNEIKCAKTFEMLTVASGESTMSRTQVQLCYNRFEKDREYANDDACPGRPSTSTIVESIEVVKEMILNKHRIIIRKVTNGAGISYGSCEAIFTDFLATKCVAVKIASKLLHFEQKQRRIGIAEDMLTTFNDDADLLKNVILVTGDES